MYKLLIIFALVVPPLAIAEAEKDEFFDSLVKGYSTYLCNPEYIACLGLSVDVCSSKLIEAAEGCSLDKFYQASSSSLPYEQASKEIQRTGEEYGACVSEKFSSLFEVPQKGHEKCASKIPPLRPVE